MVIVQGHIGGLTSYQLTDPFHHWHKTFRLTPLSCHVNQPSIPEIPLFNNSTLKFHGENHGWGWGSRSQSGTNILSTNIPFFPLSAGLPIPEIGYFKVWPRKGISIKVMGEVKVQDHWHSIDLLFLSWKSKVNVIILGHTEGLTFF